MPKNSALISFFGPSGSGKSTAFNYAKRELELCGLPSVWRADVAYPLRLVQFFAYKVFNKEIPGNPDFPESFKQDGKLLGFLAQHFEDQLIPAFGNFVRDILEREKRFPFAIVNTDCRNNAYPTLKKLGFVFVRISVEKEVLAERRARRGDTSGFDYSAAVEQISAIEADYTIENSGPLLDFEKEAREVVHKVLYKVLKDGDI